MTAIETPIEDRLKAFKASSSFTPGDPQSFSIPLSNELDLPGKFDPVSYMEQLQADVLGKNVLVVCPGNGGLCVAALRAGASTVVAIEPRSIYDRALIGVSDFASEVIGATFSRRGIKEEIVEKFDIVFWTEGLDEVAHPKGLFEEAINSLAPKGLFYLEVSHGHHAELPDSTNAWRPKAEAFTATMSRYSTVEIVTVLEGRDQTRKIYTIKDNETRVEETPAEETDAQVMSEIRESREELAEKLSGFVSDDYIDEKILKVEPATEETEATKQTLVEAAVEKIKKILPVDTSPGEDFDSVYEGRASTPKAKKKKSKNRGKSKS
jgi:hypothetical protein